MLNVFLVGYGKMGKLIEKTIKESKDMQVVAIAAGFDAFDVSTIQEKVDVIIDFSHPSNLSWLIPYIKEQHIPYICGTTGHSEEEKASIQALSSDAAIIFQANFSFGIAVVSEILKLVTPLLEDSFDMEVVETHHNQKQDAPSGTAKMLVDILNQNNEYQEVHGRNGFVGKRQKEIGIHAIRGGTIAGEHSVLYLGEDESIEIKHSATSKQIFVNGALRAARFAVNKPYGMYTMKDILFS